MYRSSAWSSNTATTLKPDRALFFGVWSVECVWSVCGVCVSVQPGRAHQASAADTWVPFKASQLK